MIKRAETSKNRFHDEQKKVCFRNKIVWHIPLEEDEIKT